MVKLNAEKNSIMREMLSDVVKKHDYTLQPITLEAHQIEW